MWGLKWWIYVTQIQFESSAFQARCDVKRLRSETLSLFSNILLGTNNLTNTCNMYFFLFVFCFSVQWWSPLLLVPPVCPPMSLIGMFRGSVAFAGTKPRAFTSMLWHVRAARDFSGKQLTHSASEYVFHVQVGPYNQNGARSATYRTVYTLEAQVSDVKTTHTGHHALNIITTHTSIKTHTNTADGIGGHADAQQQVANDWASSTSIHTDAQRKTERATCTLSVWMVWCFPPFEFVPRVVFVKNDEGKKADVLKRSFLVSQLAFVWTLASMLVSHLCIIVHADMSSTDWIVCLVSLFCSF